MIFICNNKFHIIYSISLKKNKWFKSKESKEAIKNIHDSLSNTNLLYKCFFQLLNFTYKYIGSN